MGETISPPELRNAGTGLIVAQKIDYE